MSSMTITEALADLRTIDKRLEKKRAFVLQAVGIPQSFKDPLEKHGGTPDAIKAELQAINDLNARKVAIRCAIADSNAKVTITVDGRTASVASWLIWRRDVAPSLTQFLTNINSTIQDLRRRAATPSRSSLLGAQPTVAPDDVTIFIDETWLKNTAEDTETILGTLDGLLSLKNATTTIEV